MDYEIYHSGVKGMKWGVRKADAASSAIKNTSTNSATNGMSTKVTHRKNKTTITSEQGTQKAKLTVKRNRGAKLVAKNEGTKVKVIMTNTANVTAGALRVAAAFIPGMSVLNGVATAVSLGGTIASLKK